MSLACHNGWQQLVHSPSVVVTKKKRESIHEIDEPSQANTAGGRLVDNSFLRKVAHIQDDSKATMPRNLKDSIYTRYSPIIYLYSSPSSFFIYLIYIMSPNKIIIIITIIIIIIQQTIFLYKFIGLLTSVFSSF